MLIYIRIGYEKKSGTETLKRLVTVKSIFEAEICSSRE